MRSRKPANTTSYNCCMYRKKSRVLMILPVDLSTASESSIFVKCLDHFKLSSSLIDNGKWASVAKGQVVRTLETQIDETRVMVPNSSIWAFPKSEIISYAQTISLIKSKLADKEQRYTVVVCDPNMPAQAMRFSGKWPRGSATNRRLNPRPASNEVALPRGNYVVRGRGGRLRGHGGRGYVERSEHGGNGGYGGHDGYGGHYGYGGHGGHTLPPTTIIYTEALRSIVSVVTQAAQNVPQYTGEDVFWGRGRARGRPPIICHSCRAFGHLRRDCPKKCMYL